MIDQKPNPLLHILPQPSSVEKATGTFVFSGPIRVTCDPAFTDAQTILSHKLSQMEGVEISDEAKQEIVLVKSNIDNDQGDEGYILEIEPNKITIYSQAYGGIFYGVQTVIQLITTHDSPAIPCGKITDHPRYAWRGFMLDVGRYFYTKDELLKIIDILSFYKVNTFQLHLTDDQGWRIEIKSLPRLTEIGSIHDPRDQLKGGFYTQDEMREVIEYARLRNISIIPEIDLPGHCQAAIAAYPELSCFGKKVEVRSFNFRKPNLIDGTPFSDPLCVGREENYDFIDQIIREVAELFPSDYIHLGGDECSTGAWKICDRCQQQQKDNGLKDEHGLQGYFMTRVNEIVRSYGKISMGWDEIYEAKVSKDFAVMAWRDDIWGVDAANDGYQVIMAPSQYYYYNRDQAPSKERVYSLMTTLPFMYGYRPSFHKINPENRENIFGIQSCFWGGGEWDHAMTQLFPRFLAFAEQAWSVKEDALETFVQRMNFQYAALDEKNINYYVEHPSGLHDDPCDTEEYTVNLSVSISSAEIRYTLDGTEPSKESNLFKKSFRVPIGTVIKAKTFLSNGRSSSTVEGTSVKAQRTPSIEVENPQPGVHLSIREGVIETTVDFEKLPEIYSGITDQISYPNDHLKTDFALHFSGYIDIPEDGVYGFFSTSADGSNLYIDDELFLSNDFEHPKLSVTKRILLAKGLHKIRLDYFYNSIFEKFFTLEVDGPNLLRQYIPSDMLFH